MGAILVKFALDKKQEIANFYALPGACKACYDLATANSENSSKLYEFGQCSGQSYEVYNVTVVLFFIELNVK
jgi:hypothetical protein